MMVTSQDLPSRSTLDELPGRALTFLRGVGTSPTLRILMTTAGYSNEEHLGGWQLLHLVSGYAPGRAGFAPDADPAVSSAVAELDRWDEPNFARVEAMLRRRFPRQRDFVFANLQPAQGAAAVLSVCTFLDRLDQMETGEGRKDTHKEDLAALGLMASRGIDKAERKRLRKLVETAQNGTQQRPGQPAEKAEAGEMARQIHEAALLDLYLWHRDWAASARSVIKRRDHLIRLGLAKRKTAATGDEPEPTPTPQPTPA